MGHEYHFPLGRKRKYAPISLAAPFSLSFDLLTSKILNPFLASCTANSFPIPSVAPVITTQKEEIIRDSLDAVGEDVPAHESDPERDMYFFT